MVWRVIGRFVRRDITRGFRKFHAIVDTDVARAAQSLPAPPDIVQQQVEDAVAQSLRS